MFNCRRSHVRGWLFIVYNSVLLEKREGRRAKYVRFASFKFQLQSSMTLIYMDVVLVRRGSECGVDGVLVRAAATDCCCELFGRRTSISA